MSDMWPAMQKKVADRNKRIAEMVDAACTKGGKGGGAHVRPLQALNLVHDGCERVGTDSDEEADALCAPRLMTCTCTLPIPMSMSAS